MPSVFVIIPVFDRKAITLQCLEQLRSNGDLDWVKVLVMDDNSPDGTAAAIEENYPEVKVLRGDGNLWWTGGIKWGMEHACQNGADFMVWLNDDCLPAPGSLRTLVEHATKTGSITLSAAYQGGSYYGGFLKTRSGLKLLPFLPQELQSCDTFNGNFVCIPRSVVDAVGFPDAKSLPQCYADSDYGLRATLAGFRATIVGSAKSWNRSDATPTNRSILKEKVAPMTVLKSWRWKKSACYLPALWTYKTRHWRTFGVFLFFFETLSPLILSVWAAYAPAGFRLWPSTVKQWYQRRRHKDRNLNHIDDKV